MDQGSAYSKTPLARKLGIKQGHRIYLHQPPDYYWRLFDELPSGILQVDQGQTEAVDFMHFFVNENSELDIALHLMLPKLKKDGALWISWPKKTSGIHSEVDKWKVLQAGRNAGLVDVKVAAIDETWSGQKFMYRRSDRH